MSLEDRPFTYEKLSLEQLQLEELIELNTKERDFAIKSILTSITGKSADSRKDVVREYTNFVKHSARATVATQVSDMLDLDRKVDFYNRYEAGMMGHLLSSAYPESNIGNPMDFIRPIPRMARLALTTSMLEFGDTTLLQMRRDLGKPKNGKIDNTVTPAIGTLIAEYQEAA